MVMTEEILVVIVVPYGTAFKGKHVHNMKMYMLSDLFFNMSILRFLEKEHSYLIVSGTPYGESALSTQQMWKPRKHGQ